MEVIQLASMGFSVPRFLVHPLITYGLWNFFWHRYLLANFQCSALVAKSEDSLQNPQLTFKNMARFKCLANSLKHVGPVAIARDCTKLHQQLSYLNNFGSHVLSSVLPMEECEVGDTEDVNTAIDHIKNQKGMATQVHAIMAKINYQMSFPKHADELQIVRCFLQALNILL